MNFFLLYAFFTLNTVRDFNFFLSHICTFGTENLFENWQLNKVWQDLSFVFTTTENNNQSGFFPFEQKNSDTEGKKWKRKKFKRKHEFTESFKAAGNGFPRHIPTISKALKNQLSLFGIEPISHMFRPKDRIFK